MIRSFQKFFLGLLDVKFHGNDIVCLGTFVHVRVIQVHAQVLDSIIVQDDVYATMLLDNEDCFRPLTSNLPVFSYRSNSF